MGLTSNMGGLYVDRGGRNGLGMVYHARLSREILGNSPQEIKFVARWINELWQLLTGTQSVVEGHSKKQCSIGWSEIIVWAEDTIVRRANPNLGFSAMTIIKIPSFWLAQTSSPPA